MVRTRNALKKKKAVQRFYRNWKLNNISRERYIKVKNMRTLFEKKQEEKRGEIIEGIKE